MSIITETPVEEFRKIVKNSKCYADICRNLGLRIQGGYYNTIKRKIKNNNIDISHFLSIKELMSNVKNPIYIDKKDFIQRMNSNSLHRQSTIKKKLLEFNLIEYKCDWCGISNEWNGKPIVLQLDHIDGNHKNNKLENFRWLCPNCHSQTETYCGKSKKKKNYKCKCGKNIYKESRLCVRCEMERRKKINKSIIVKTGKPKPTKNELYKLIKEKSFLEIGRMYGVSGNAIVKWCKSYGLPHRKKDIKWCGR